MGNLCSQLHVHDPETYHQSGWEQPAGVVTLEPARSSGYGDSSPTRQSNGSARPRTAQQSGEDSGHQQEPVHVQSSPHRPMRQKASLGSGGTAGLGIALTDKPQLVPDVNASINSAPTDCIPASRPDRSAVASSRVERFPIGEKINWQIGEMVGAGAFGRVYLGLNNDTGQLMAVKQVLISKEPTVAGRVAVHVAGLEDEVGLLKQLDHPNIVRYLGTEKTDETLNIFLEYVPGGSIASLLAKFGAFKETMVKVYCRQILLGLEYLHKNHIMHRDIKGANILVDNAGRVKLADFGASKQIEDLVTIDSGNKSMKGTPYWMAPEVIKQTGHGRQADIWSVGCTVIEMATGKPPWSQFQSQVSALFHIASSKGPPPIPENISPECRDFLLLCFNRVPKERPNATRLLQHPFLAGVGHKSAPLHGALTLNTTIPPRMLGDLPSPILEEPSQMGTAPTSPQTPHPRLSPGKSLEGKAARHLAQALHHREVEAKENKGNLEGPRQNSPPRQPFRASQTPHQQQPWGQPQPLVKPWAQVQPQQHPWDPPQPARHQWGQAASQTREAANPWGQQQSKAVEYGAPQWQQAVPRRPGQAQAEGENAVWGPPAAQEQNKPPDVGDAEGWTDAVPLLSAESSASMSDAFNPVEDPDSFDAMYACDSMDNAEPVSRRPEMCGSHESLAASSPSTSMHLGSGAGQQSRPGGFAHQGGQESFPKQARAEGLAGREGGGAYADPDDVEVNLEGQDSAWGEENDILSYVQSKARQDTLRCSMPFLERSVRADSVAAAMTDLEDQSGSVMPKHQEWEAELAKELAIKRSQQRNMAGAWS
ncbi:hypothetical protein WJX77_001730 [Trebouxia sp. C0004]